MIARMQENIAIRVGERIARRRNDIVAEENRIGVGVIDVEREITKRVAKICLQALPQGVVGILEVAAADSFGDGQNIIIILCAEVAYGPVYVPLPEGAEIPAEAALLGPEVSTHLRLPVARGPVSKVPGLAWFRESLFQRSVAGS